MSAPPPDDQVKFLVNLQRLLNEGSFVASYKYALLLAISDLCIERGDDSGAPFRLSSRDLAERFVALYWPQAAPYVAIGRTPAAMTPRFASPGRPPAIELVAREQDSVYGAAAPLGARVLKQNTGRQAKVIEDIARIRMAYRGSLAALRADEAAWRRLVGAVATTIAVMPLWKLQTIGRERLDFLYREGATRNEIELQPGISYCFRRFHALIRDLVQGAWVRFVRRVPENAGLIGEAAELGEFLFGSERGNLDAHRSILRDVQDDRCFYCTSALQGPGEVDHFIPWSMYRFDLGHNFVVAHAACNNDKRDRLAAIEHLERWTRRNSELGADLASRFDGAGLLHDLAATWQVTRWAYAQAEAAGAQVWIEPKDRLTPLTSTWRPLLDPPSMA